MSQTSPHHSLALMLRTLKLPTFAAMHEQVALRGDRDGWTLGQSLQHLCELEIEERRRKRIERILKAADLPTDKTLATLDTKRWPTKVQRQIPALCSGDFVDRAENILLFGLPGRGKTHLAAAIGHETSADTFNPVIVDFYREVGYLPDAIINYLLLLGWSLDDKTEEFTRDEMIKHFSLERVNKSPASFDPQKLSAFQLRHMQQLPIKQKVAMVLPYLQKVGHVASPPACDTAPMLTKIVEAAGDRIKTAGDILEFDEFFVSDDAMPFDEKAFEKRVRKEGTPELLKSFRSKLAELERFDHETCEAALRSFIEANDIKIGDIIHALRVAVTGKGVGLGMFEALELLGKDRCLARIDRCLEHAAG